MPYRICTLRFSRYSVMSGIVAAEVMIGGTQRKDLVYGQVRIPSQGKHYELPHVFLLQANESGLITEVAAYL